MSARKCLPLVRKAIAPSQGIRFVSNARTRLFQQSSRNVGVVGWGAAKLSLHQPLTSPTRMFSSIYHEESNSNITSNESRGGHFNQEKIVARKTDKILHDIPVGHMSHEDRETARRSMMFWSRKKTPDGAEATERLLERLVSEEAERPDPERRHFAVRAKDYNIAISAWAKSGSERCAEKADAVWTRMQERFEEGRRNDLSLAQPDRYTIHSVMDAYAHSPAADAPERVEQLLSLLEQLSSDPQSNISLSTMSFNILMNTYASRRGEHGSAEKAEDVLLRMSEMNKKGDASIRPDVHSFNTVLKAWHNSGSCLESASRADNILRFMTKLHKDGHDNVRPDDVSMETCLRAYGKVENGGSEVAEKIEGLLQLLEEVAVDDYQTDYTDCYNVALSAILRSGVDDAWKRARSIFERMSELGSERKINVHPDDKTHALLLNARLGFSAVSVKSEEAIRFILNDASESGIKVRTESLNKAMNILWKSVPQKERLDAARQAEKILTFMETSPLINPDSSSYNILVTAFLKSDEKGAAEQALEILRRQERAYNSGNAGAKPDGYGYNAVLTSFSRSSNTPSEARESAKRAYEILKMMERQEKEGNLAAAPDIVSYNITLKSLAQAETRDAANRAILLLKRLEERSASNHVYPDEITYGSVLNALRRGGDWDTDSVAGKALSIFNRMKAACQEESGRLRVDTHVYKTLLSILAGSGELQRARSAYNILQEMLEASKRNECNEPDSLCCNLVVQAFSAAGSGSAGARGQGSDPKAATLAQQVLVDLVKQYRAGRMSSVPNTIGFNHVLKAWQKTRSEVAIENAEKVLKLMNELQGGGVENVKPDKVTLSLMLTMYSTRLTAESAQRAQNLFDSSVGEVEIDRAVYENLMNCWAKSDATDKVQKVQGIMKVMEDKCNQGDWKLRPNTRTYNILLNSCSHVVAGGDKQQALETAREAYQELKDSTECKPDPITFGSMIRAICDLSEDESNKVAEVKRVFDECCESGMCGDMVIKVLRHGLGEEGAAELMGAKPEDIRTSWKRNIRDYRSKRLSRMLGQKES